MTVSATRMRVALAYLAAFAGACGHAASEFVLADTFYDALRALLARRSAGSAG